MTVDETQVTKETSYRDKQQIVRERAEKHEKRLVPIPSESSNGSEIKGLAAQGKLGYASNVNFREKADETKE